MTLRCRRRANQVEHVLVLARGTRKSKLIGGRSQNNISKRLRSAGEFRLGGRHSRVRTDAPELHWFAGHIQYASWWSTFGPLVALLMLNTTGQAAIKSHQSPTNLTYEGGNVSF